MTALSIIIVNYKTPRLLVDCLRSIHEETSGVAYEVIVVDNASGDDSRAIVTSAFPTVQWIQLDYNAGFARANNEGIRQAAGEVVLLLNSDTIVTEGAIGRCHEAFVQSHYVACGVQLLNADGTPQISGNYFMRGGLNHLLPLPYTGQFVKWLGSALKVKKPHVPDATKEIEVDWINGAFLMVKKSAIEKAGLMDEDFFLYAEEAEWCYRLSKIGSLVIYGQCRVIHLQGETSNATFGSESRGYYNLYDRKGLQIMLSNFVRIRKQFGVGWFVFHLLAYTFTIPLYFVISLFKSLGRKNGKSLKSVKQFSGNMMKIWALSTTIVRNKPYFYKVL